MPEVEPRYGGSTSGTSTAWRFAAALGGVVVAFDQAAKAAIEANLTAGEHLDVLGPLGLTLVHNRGVAFGLASGGGSLLIALTVVALLFVAALFAREPDRWGMWPAVGLLVGGALGNLADRIRADAVTDYVELLSWPPFNLADVAITAGVIVLGLSYARQSPP